MITFISKYREIITEWYTKIVSDYGDRRIQSIVVIIHSIHRNQAPVFCELVKIIIWLEVKNIYYLQNN